MGSAGEVAFATFTVLALSASAIVLPIVTGAWGLGIFVLFVPPLALLAAYTTRNRDVKLEFSSTMSIFGWGFFGFGTAAGIILYGLILIIAYLGQAAIDSNAVLTIILICIPACEAFVMNAMFYAAMNFAAKLGANFENPKELRAYEYTSALGVCIFEAYALCYYYAFVFYNALVPLLVTLAFPLFHMHGIYTISLRKFAAR